MVRATETLDRQLRHYEAESDRFRQSEAPAAWAEAQEVVAYANFVYDRIKRIDEEWSAELVAKAETPSAADARAVWDLYARWCGKAEADLRRATELDAGGSKVSGLDRLRHAYYEARDLLSIPPERTHQSAQSAREGRARSLGEIRDELRRALDR